MRPWPKKKEREPLIRDNELINLLIKNYEEARAILEKRFPSLIKVKPSIDDLVYNRENIDNATKRQLLKANAWCYRFVITESALIKEIECQQPMWVPGFETRETRLMRQLYRSSLKLWKERPAVLRKTKLVMSAQSAENRRFG